MDDEIVDDEIVEDEIFDDEVVDIWRRDLTVTDLDICRIWIVWLQATSSMRLRVLHSLAGSKPQVHKALVADGAENQ